MNNLHLSVLNEGDRYEQLRRFATKLHSGQWDEWTTRNAVRAVCSDLARGYAKRFDEEIPGKDELEACVSDVLAWHAARIAEEPPVYTWQVTRDNGRMVRFTREQDAFAYILNNQGQSVHYALTYGGWSYGPIG